MNVNQRKQNRLPFTFLVIKGKKVDPVPVKRGVSGSKGSIARPPLPADTTTQEQCPQYRKHKIEFFIFPPDGLLRQSAVLPGFDCQTKPEQTDDQRKTCCILLLAVVLLPLLGAQL